MGFKLPELGDLVSFVDASPDVPGDMGLVIGVDHEHVVVLWPWGVNECSVKAFMGDSWGNLVVVRHND
jgi:hypothetical protein